MASIRESIALGEKIRVLVVDDSFVMRRTIGRILDSDPGVHVVGTACDGFDALAKIEQLKPHVVTLDVEMPKLDGMATLREIAAHHPGVHVIMLSSLTANGAQITIEALMQGASDYVSKPAPAIDSGVDHLAANLLFKVKQFFVRTLHASVESVSPPLPPSLTGAPPAIGGLFDICALGVSTGGPSALLEVLPMFPADFPLPIVIVQHMPAMFTQLLAERLNGVCSISVAEGKRDMILQPGQAVLAPGGFHMRVIRTGSAMVVKIDEGPKENSCRPSVDVLFRSIADNLGGRAIAAVMTGMGQDGLAGARLLKCRGATILAQDQATSVVWGMPGAVVRANLAERVLPLARIVPEILGKVGCR